MTEPLAHRTGSYPPRAAPEYAQGSSSTNLADILERVLDKGIVIAGDIRINLLDIELLTVKLRLLVASVDKAKEMGIDWWEHDPSLSSRASQDGTARSLAAGEPAPARGDRRAAGRGPAARPGRGALGSAAVRRAAVRRGERREAGSRWNAGRTGKAGGAGTPGDEQERGARRRPERSEREARPTTRDRREARDRSPEPSGARNAEELATMTAERPTAEEPTTTGDLPHGGDVTYVYAVARDSTALRESAAGLVGVGGAQVRVVGGTDGDGSGREEGGADPEQVAFVASSVSARD
ncbi:gas vesicle protein GvpJ [Streptomyces sp. SJL17-1]|uniref:gas vesicle protein n=1 Tax=Streptomyces sp. SJL17-1 TaxID=2967223 RepID=UPI00398FC5D9